MRQDLIIFRLKDMGVHLCMKDGLQNCVTCCALNRKQKQVYWQKKKVLWHRKRCLYWQHSAE